ncbi:urea carboxylase [Mycolicibacterium vaccae]|uniref:urea carboxylase n=1 Tax=Mycolicibacterium vaccae TaxID=1810 RepID=UPI003CFD1F4E
MTAGRVLIANRGEIAVRLVRAARQLGMDSVAVFSDADRGAPHVHLADDAVRLGPAAPRESYLRTEAILAAAAQTGATIIHPGYGFLSEDAEFAAAVEAAGLVFAGPTPAQLRCFGTKHTARDAARAAGVPIFAGSDLLDGADDAVATAETIGYPVMLKATGGGGGIGMQICCTADELRSAYQRVVAQAERSFGSAGVFVERYVQNARHVEVQIFGDGAGRVLSLGDRDCSLQRRHQKVIEEAPAPALPDDIRERLHSSSRALAESVDYRSAGTVEFIYDPVRREASFLEVNARLQVEHPVTEAVTGVDLAGWMLRLATGDTAMLDAFPTGVLPTTGHAVEARVYAEDPMRDYRPSTGTLTSVRFPTEVRVDTWVADGTEVTASYDPLLAKIVTAGADRDQAWDRLRDALAQTELHGIEVNTGLLCAAAEHDDVRAAVHSTATLAHITDPRPRITVERPGLMTTVQDVPGRVGLWQVGVPPSGPMDDLSFRLGNRALGNPEEAAGLECTAAGPALRMTHATTVCVTGAECLVTVDGKPVPMWEPVEVPADGVLDVGTAAVGLRTYILVAGGLDVPTYLGSASTFTLGRFGGHGGRELVVGDVLRARPVGAPLPGAGPVPPEIRPALTDAWELAVTEGPHGAPEFFTRDDIDTLFSAGYRVHFNSARTGVRLEGPKPRWARPDGGEAGLHPSNIHDNAYSVGALDFTGDTPILLGPDGPSLGGFVCPVTVIAAQRWKLGQLRPGDTVRFVPVRSTEAPSRRELGIPRGAGSVRVTRTGDGDDGVLARRSGVDGAPDVAYRRSGDDNVLVEYGDIVLDLALRARVHALHTRLDGAAPGILDLTPGIRSLQVHVDPDVLPIPRLLGLLSEIEDELPASSELVVPSRLVRLPLSWDDPATREAIARYTSGVRDDAPWCPSNIDFIRRINGLASEDDVRNTVYEAQYLTLGLGDVYLGAPVATPLDPRHRLVTTKYNPARTWTAENSVGIGGAYLCIYGMEGPGGYQFVGRTTQVWSRYRQSPPFEPGSPWLLRFFDRISWYPVSAEELLEMRADIAAGRGSIDITEGTFSLAEHERFLTDNAEDIAAFRSRQSAAFADERAAWAAAGEFDRAERAAAVSATRTEDLVLDEGDQRVDAPFASSVWKVDVAVGDEVVAGQPLLALEAMKMETVLRAPSDGVVTQILVSAGHQVDPGTPLVIVGDRS